MELSSRANLAQKLGVLLIVAMVGTVVPAISLLVSAPNAQAQNPPEVVLSEFMAANDNIIVDNTGEFEDWIELHNTSGATIDLAGWIIADSSESFAFPAGLTIAANEYLLIFASGDIARTTATELHLPFKLSAGGDSLTLADPTNQVSTPSWPPPSGFPPQLTDVSYGLASGGQERFFTTPTPGAANGGGVNGVVDRVTFSVPHGFYTSTQTVVLDTTTAGATIRYTLDGSTPTSTTGTAISPGGSVTIDPQSTSVATVRAMAYRSGWIDSAAETRTYLFADEVALQSESTPAGWPDHNEINGADMNYGMDPNVPNAASSLTAIPSLSIVTDLDNLFDPDDGIYVNPHDRGAEWERPASIELIDPTQAEPGFDINGGIRIRGGFSRSTSNPKHSLRLFFKDDYGDGDLEYPLFGSEGTDTFAKVDLRTSQNYGWQWRRDDGEFATYIDELWSRDTQGEMGQPYTRSRQYHLYLNGQYWGLYMTQERVSGEYGESYFGGVEDDYDVLKRSQPGRENEATNGTDTAWRSLWPYVSDLSITTAEYDYLETQVDMVSLADYYLLHFWTGDYDGSPSWYFQSNGQRWAGSNNWYAARNRNGVGQAGKWLFFDHDSEHSLCAPNGPTGDQNVDNTPPWNQLAGSVGPQYMSPAFLHESLVTHPAYRQIFQDRVAIHMGPGGVLTTASAQARLDTRAAHMSPAVEAESARWGDSTGNPAYQRSDWNAALAELSECFTQRPAIVQQQLTADGLWPDAAAPAPTMTPTGTAVPWGTNVSIDAGAQPGFIWVTTDGTDPRGTDGNPANSAMAYNSPIVITAATTIKARVLDGSDWSTLGENDYTLSTPAGGVRIILNEFNAVGSGNFLGGGLEGDVANGSDATFGRVLGNGGDWFELVVIEDGLDIRGWQVQVWNNTGVSVELTTTLQFTDAAELSDLAGGTLVTVSEDLIDDVSYSPPYGDYHINLQSNSSVSGAFVTAATQSNFAINNNDTQIAVLDENGEVVSLRTGEGTAPGVSVNGQEVFKLEGAPTTSITPTSAEYNDGTTSTWGLPNTWQGGAVEQDFSGIRELWGDVNCDNRVDVNDALFIVQGAVGSRTPSVSCPLGNPTTEIYENAGDIDSDGSVSVNDALIVLQCSVGLFNSFCPQP